MTLKLNSIRLKRYQSSLVNKGVTDGKPCPLDVCFLVDEKLGEKNLEFPTTRFVSAEVYSVVEQCTKPRRSERAEESSAD